MKRLDDFLLRPIVEMALREDLGSGDVTSWLVIPEGLTGSGRFVTREECIVAGLDVVRAVFAMLDPGLSFVAQVDDGQRVPADRTIATVGGKIRAILSGERVALNFLQRMCGIATLTAKYVELVAHSRARIADTRKTTPGLRLLEKYAVAVGGGVNHRFGLSDGILIKDNHIAAAGGVTQAVAAAKKRAPHTLKIQVEVTSLDELDEAISAGADAVLLDNMDIDTMRQAVITAAGRVLLEASGGVNLDTVSSVADTGVDIISVGALTHSVPAADIALDFEGN